VWSVRHASSGRTIAAKIVRRAGRSWSSVHREAQLLASLDHPNVVDIYDLLPLDAQHLPESLAPFAGEPCLLMEFADAGSLAARGNTAWPIEAFVGLCRDVLLGLGHVAANGWMHLDLKPGNVLLFAEPGGLVARLADFGVGQRGNAETVGGTAMYAPPEQRRGQPVRARSDLYAAGRMFASLPLVLPCPRQRDAVRGWLATLQADAPDDRFASAAHAYDALLHALALEEGDEPWTVPDAQVAPSTEQATTPVLTRIEAPQRPLAVKAEAPRHQRAMPSLRSVATLRRARPRIGDGFALLDARRTRLEGRAAELDAFCACVVSARASATPALVTIEGPVGVGVTRLLEAGAAQAHERFGAELLDWRGQAAAARSGLSSGTRATTPTGGVAVILLDAATLSDAVLDGVASVLRGAGPVVIAVARPGPSLAHHGLRPTLALALQPLTEPIIRAILSRAVRLDDRVAQSIAEQAHGRPELALRTLRDWQRDGVIAPRDGAWVPAQDALPTPAGADRDGMDAVLALALRGSTADGWDRLASLAESALDASAAQRGLLALSWLGEPPAARAALADTIRARLLVGAGDIEGAADALVRADAAAASGLDAALREEVAVRIAATRGDVVTALARARTMAREARSASSRPLVERATIEQARAHVIRRESEEALRLLGTLEDLATLAPGLRFRVHSMRAHALIELERAAEAYPESLAAFHAGQGVVTDFALANGANDLGSCCAQLGRSTEARAWFERGLELSKDRFPMAAYIHANLASLDLAEGQQLVALRRIDAALARFVTPPLPRVGWLLRGLQVGALAAEATVAEWDEVVEAITTRGVDGVAFVEAADAAAYGARAWAARGDTARARTAWALAAQVWDATGHADRAAEARACSTCVPEPDR
jgi:tetratricopeptide (TPR) repeat protein